MIEEIEIKEKWHAVDTVNRSTGKTTQSGEKIFTIIPFFMDEFEFKVNLIRNIPFRIKGKSELFFTPIPKKTKHWNRIIELAREGNILRLKC